MKKVAFVPIRLNSKRVIGKNLKLLGTKHLLVYIFEQLSRIRDIDEIYAFCSSEEIIKYLPEHVKFLKRDKSLDRDETLGRDIYNAFVNQIDADIYILAHTTSPFIKSESISHALSKIISGDYDSALSVQKIQTFAWYQNKPLNYSLDFVPRTQDIEPVFIETSAFFMFKKEVWTKHQRRIGINPYFQIVDNIEAIDIDNPSDFDFAEKLINIL